MSSAYNGILKILRELVLSIKKNSKGNQVTLFQSIKIVQEKKLHENDPQKKENNMRVKNFLLKLNCKRLCYLNKNPKIYKGFGNFVFLEKLKKSTIPP